MRIAQISVAHPRNDTRIFHKISKTLANRPEYDVTYYVCDGEDNEHPTPNLHIVKVSPKYSMVKRIFTANIKMTIRLLRDKVDVVHFHDPELIPFGLFLKLLGKKVVYDVHELVIKSLEEGRHLKIPILQKVLTGVYRIFEGISVRAFDQLILAESGYESHFHTAYPKRLNKFTTLRNLPVLNWIGDVPQKELPEPGGYNIIYVGTLVRERGLVEMVKAMEYLDDSYHLTIAGTVKPESLLHEVQAMEGWKKVTFTGWIPAENIYGYLKSADLGLCVLHPISNYLETLPVKSFEYLASGVPILMSNFPYWEQNYNGKAFFVEPKNPEAMAAEIKRIRESPEEVDRMFADMNSFLNELSWENEQEKLFSVYQELAK